MSRRNIEFETLYYHGTFYSWLHEPQNLYSGRHIAILDAVQARQSKRGLWKSK